MASASSEAARAADRAIDPATGDFWKSSQPEYWDCAAQAWRELATFDDRQVDARQAGIHACTQRAAAIRNVGPLA